MQRKTVLQVDWKGIEGAAQGKRKLQLRSNDNDEYACPVQTCLHCDFKSIRGLRKHINTKHAWYYYFDVQPVIKRDDLTEDIVIRRKASTIKKPAFSIEEGIGFEFSRWLCTSCGGGKNFKEGKQIARRVMKFLMEAMGDNSSDLPLSNAFIDCCLGSPTIIIKFFQTLEEEWKLTCSGALNYVKAICDMVDFRKSKGISDATLRCFTATEVYLRRGRENLSKRKRIECTRNLDLETLITRNSWATLEEMEEVIPYHINKFGAIIDKCISKSPLPNIHELCFCTRFIATLLFLRVKCSRPMTYQFLTVPMLRKAKTNNGFIDQTEFKTAATYTFDTLIIDEEVMHILELYVNNVRPLLNPQCDYLLISLCGTQFQSLTNAMTILVYEAIGKYIHPTRYRQIIETESSDRLTRDEQEMITEDQKHSSTVAKIFYKKKHSRNVATAGKMCMDKMVSGIRDTPNNSISHVLQSIENITNSFDQTVLKKSENLIEQSNYSSSTITSASKCLPEDPYVNENAAVTNESANEVQPVIVNDPIASTFPDSTDLTITRTFEPISINTPNQIGNDVPLNIHDMPSIKKESSQKRVKQSNPKTIKFTNEEDLALKRGIAKYGRKSWSLILKDKSFNFHSSRTRDSLRMRADTAAFKRNTLVTE